jgi:hypothetical protein
MNHDDAGRVGLEAALQHHQAGRLSEAEAVYRQVRTEDPRSFPALHLLGVIAHQRGQHCLRTQVAVARLQLAVVVWMIGKIQRRHDANGPESIHRAIGSRLT